MNATFLTNYAYIRWESHASRQLEVTILRIT